MENIKTEIIDTAKQVSDLADLLSLHHARPEPDEPAIYIDLEGINLSRNGSLSILTLLIDAKAPTTIIYIIDVHSLGPQAFNTSGSKNTTLKDILQNDRISKVFFDVRNDSDTLFAHFGVKLQGVHDIQLMESATRVTTTSRRYLNGLAKCVANLPSHDVNQASWKLAKETGERFFKPEYGGSGQIFNKRPILEQVVSYCVGDVECLPKLWNRLQGRTNQWRDLVSEETKRRVTASQKPEYQPHGAGRALAPWSEAQNKSLDDWNEISPLHDFHDEDRDWPHASELFNEDDDNDCWDDGPTSCRDIISDSDYGLYYSD